MSGRDGRDDVHAALAVTFLLWCQGAKVPEAMHAVKYTVEESSDQFSDVSRRGGNTMTMTNEEYGQGGGLRNKSTGQRCSTCPLGCYLPGNYW